MRHGLLPSHNRLSSVVRTGGKNACNRNKNGILVWIRRRGVPISLHADAHGKFGFCLVACENPTTPEIFDCVVQGLKLPAEIEVSNAKVETT